MNETLQTIHSLRTIHGNFAEGFPHYLEWFYTKWSAGRADTTQFWTILRATGFLKPGNTVS